MLEKPVMASGSLLIHVINLVPKLKMSFGEHIVRCSILKRSHWAFTYVDVRGPGLKSFENQASNGMNFRVQYPLWPSNVILPVMIYLFWEKVGNYYIEIANGSAGTMRLRVSHELKVGPLEGGRTRGKLRPFAWPIATVDKFVTPSKYKERRCAVRKRESPRGNYRLKQCQHCGEKRTPQKDMMIFFFSLSHRIFIMQCDKNFEWNN